ncbi:PREDICTED: uncharacterized protein LOC101294544 [Fragaria vesca subsp. vesca]
MAPFETLYGKQCRTSLCWNEVGERELCGPELIHDTNENIKVVIDRLKAAQSRQKSYADVRKKDLEFQLISLTKDLIYEEEPVQILDRKEQVLRNKTIPFVKVLWRSHQVEEATWESEEQLRQKYPYVFE